MIGLGSDKKKRVRVFYTQSQTKKPARGFVVATTLPFPPGPTILGCASSTLKNPLKYILYHPYFLTFTFCRICINTFKTERAFYFTISHSRKTCTMWEVLLLSASNNQLASHLKLSSPRLLWMRDPFWFWEILLFVND